MNYKIVGKFIKDLKFSIPTKNIFSISKDISNYKINIEIKSAQVKEKIIEVDTTLSLKPIKNDFELIDTKITYSAIVEIDKDINDKKIIQNIVPLKCLLKFILTQKNIRFCV